MRVDPVQAFERTIAITEKMIVFVRQMDSKKLFSMMQEEKILETLEWLQDNVLK